MGFNSLIKFSFFLILLISCDFSGNDEGRYFPMPENFHEVIQTDSQSFISDTVVSELVRPWSMEFLPDNRVIITERGGKLRIVENGQLKDEPVKGNIPMELRDVKLHPEYEQNGWIYISYYINPDENNSGYTVLMRGRLDGDRFIDDQVLYKAGPFRESGGYFGSRIEFDKEGYLYFLVGGRTIDERHRRINIQDLSSNSGKTMRLYDDGRIPPDNPFTDSTDALPEIYSYGHRQHQGLVLHPISGKLWSTEHGEKDGDELNIIYPGRNYGWPLATWSTEYDGGIISEDPLLEGTEPPVHYWTPSIAPSGLDFITGNNYPGWKGDLFVGSLSQRMLNRVEMSDGEPVRDEKLLEGIGRVRSVKYAPDYFLYLLTEDTGLLVRLIPAK